MGAAGNADPGVPCECGMFSQDRIHDLLVQLQEVGVVSSGLKGVIPEECLDTLQRMTIPSGLKIKFRVSSDSEPMPFIQFTLGERTSCRRFDLLVMAQPGPQCQPAA